MSILEVSPGDYDGKDPLDMAFEAIKKAKGERL